MTDTLPRSIRCAVCSSSVPVGEPRSPHFPFCSERCKLIDLGRWLNGSYGIDPASGQIDLVDPETAEDVTDELKRH